MSQLITGRLIAIGGMVSILGLAAGCGGGASPPSGAGRPPVTRPPASFNAVTTQALNWLAARSTRPLGAPTWIPPLPASAKKAYLSPTAHVSGQGWAIALDITDHPYGVNAPAINRSPHTHPFVSWGMDRLDAGQLQTAATPEGRLRILEAYSQMGPDHPAVVSGQPETVSLGKGITGALYGNGNLIWHQGKWTVIVEGSNGPRDVVAAKPVAGYLHSHLLPPGPGLIAINNYGSTDTASVDWLDGPSLFSIMGGQTPALAVCHMAVSWRSYGGGR